MRTLLFILAGGFTWLGQAAPPCAPLLSDASQVGRLATQATREDLPAIDFDDLVRQSRLASGPRVWTPADLRKAAREVAWVMLGRTSFEEARRQGNPFIYPQQNQLESDGLWSGNASPPAALVGELRNETAREIARIQGEAGLKVLQRSQAESRFAVIVHQFPNSLEVSTRILDRNLPKIFLVVHEFPLFSNATGPNSVQIYSDGGELLLPTVAPTIDMHGGFVSGCMAIAMVDLARHSLAPDLRFIVNMKASYTVDGLQEDIQDVIAQFEEVGYWYHLPDGFAHNRRFPVVTELVFTLKDDTTPGAPKVTVTFE